jgi:hypothetical protein
VSKIKSYKDPIRNRQAKYISELEKLNAKQMDHIEKLNNEISELRKTEYNSPDAPNCTTFQANPTPKLIFKGGAASTPKPKLFLIPYNALVGLANRFELGWNKYKDNAYNAISPPSNARRSEMLQDQEWIRERISHVIHHAYQYLQKMEGVIEDDGDDDASAIMWGGACLSESYRVRKQG